MSLIGLGAFGSEGVSMDGPSSDAQACYKAGKTPIASDSAKLYFGCAPQPQPSNLPAGEKWFGPGCTCPAGFIYDTTSGKCVAPLGQAAAVDPTGCSTPATTYLLYIGVAAVVGYIAWKALK